MRRREVAHCEGVDPVSVGLRWVEGGGAHGGKGGAHGGKGGKRCGDGKRGKPGGDGGKRGKHGGDGGKGGKR